MLAEIVTFATSIISEERKPPVWVAFWLTMDQTMISPVTNPDVKKIIIHRGKPFTFLLICGVHFLQLCF